ncbi:hypothetical protein [Endozoicomonas atrinae]|uniref:hypothetical protein n=1 Tax=Endozoicomonas atrinae TaxID=1333660 RepID=UPI003AFFA240
MNELNLMGINSMTMFPDFDGVCASMKEKFFNNVGINPMFGKYQSIPRSEVTACHRAND